MERTMDRTSYERGTSSRDVAQDLEHEIERLRADLRQLRGDVATIGGDAMRAARTGVNEGLRAAGERARQAAQTVENQVAAHPYLALAAAFAAGLALGVRTGRRD